MPPEALEEIDERAAQRGMDRTAYMIAASTGRLDGLDLNMIERQDELDARLKRVERVLFDAQ